MLTITGSVAGVEHRQPGFLDRDVGWRHRRGIAPGRIVSLGLLLLAVSMLCALLLLTLGIPKVAAGDLPGILFGQDGSTTERVIVRELRAPRLVLAILAGAALGLAGGMLQITLRNPLAAPELLGVSSGASLVMACVVMLHLPVTFALYPPLALAGGLAGGALVLALARDSANPIETVLTGVAVATVLNGLIIGVISLAARTGDVQMFYLFTVGSLSNRTWSHVQMAAPWILIAIPAALLLTRSINTLQLGEDLAASLGVNAGRTRVLSLLVAAMLVASVVAVSGPIAWVGLVAPHIARLLVGTPSARVVLPAAALTGVAVLLTADVLSKLLLYPREIPVGICTTFIAAPVMLFLLNRRRLGAVSASAER